jgi:hypothetical protein
VTSGDCQVKGKICVFHTNYSNSYNINYVPAVLVGLSVSQSDFSKHSHCDSYVRWKQNRLVKRFYLQEILSK